MDGPWRIELLGWLRATRGDCVVDRFGGRKAGTLLAYLAYFPHRSHPRDALADWLWPAAPPDAGRAKLRQALTSLRHQLEPPGISPGAVIVADRSTIRLNPAACVTDVARFDAALAAARIAGTDEQTQRLADAIELYRGDLLPSYHDPWILPERQRLAEACLQALDRLVMLQEAAGDLEAALRWARRSVGVDPLREESHRHVIRLLAAAGRPREAQEQYRELERLLAEELGAVPEQQTRALLRALDAQHSPLPLGHKARASKQRSQPDHDRERSSTERTPAWDTPPPAPLPLQLTRFFGREAEIAALVELLKASGTQDTEDPPLARLVTLTGPGGSGKTRLALEAAVRLQRAGLRTARFVPLVDLADPQRIVDRVRDVLRLPRLSDHEPLEQVVAALSREPALLLLDNLEHLFEAGGDLARTLLERVATLSVLVTSRQALDLPGEREFPVGPLPVPTKDTVTPQALLEYPSVQLFVDRAQAARPDFQITSGNAAAVAALCARLEGIPLAIELAASRAWVLTPAQMLARLSQRFELLTSRKREADARHCSLRATLDWSYQLLSPELQRFFARLCVFRGGWTIAAAERVCEEPNALEYLDRLRACSLVLAEETCSPVTVPEMRFRMLETLREYGGQQLAPKEFEELQEQHAAYYLALAEQAEPELKGREMGRWLERLEQEQDNLRAALAWSVAEVPERAGAACSAGSRSEIGLRLAGALLWFWRERSHFREGHDWLERALGREARGSPARAKALAAAGHLGAMHGDPTARARLEESLALWQQLGDRQGLASVLNMLGWRYLHQENCEAARAAAAESLQIYEESGDRARAAGVYTLLGCVAFRSEEDASARTLFEKSLALAREEAFTSQIAWALWNLGDVAQVEGDPGSAQARYEESLTLFGELNARQGMAAALGRLAGLAHERGDERAAAALHEECLSLAWELGDRTRVAASLAGLAAVAAAEGQPERAARLLGAAEALRDRVDAFFRRMAQVEHERHIAALRAALGEEAFAAAWADGRALPLEQAVALAREMALPPTPAADRR